MNAFSGVRVHTDNTKGLWGSQLSTRPLLNLLIWCRPFHSSVCLTDCGDTITAASDIDDRLQDGISEVRVKAQVGALTIWATRLWSDGTLTEMSRSSPFPEYQAYACLPYDWTMSHT